MTIFKPMVLALAGASVIALAAAPANAAPGMNGRPDLSAATTDQVMQVQWRRHGGRAAAAAGIGFAAGALIGAAAANAAPRSYYYGDSYYGSPYGSYGYYQPAPTYYEPAPTYYYDTAPTYYAPYAPSYNYYRSPSAPTRFGSQTHDPLNSK